MTSRFVPTYRSEPFPTNAYDPVIFPGEHFDDGQHRVLILFNNDRNALYKTADYDTFTEVNADWLPDEPATGNDTFQSAVVLGDGTFALYQNDGNDETTAVWTATAADIDAGTPTRLGRVLATEGDCGAFYDAATDTVHIYAESVDHRYGSVSSSAISHWSTPADDLLNATSHGLAFDNGGVWGTGDPCVIEHDGAYWMFMDYTTNHPTYWVALARSTDLHTFELVDPKLTEQAGTRAGDFDVVSVGENQWVAMCEYTGGDAGVGVFDLTTVERPVRGLPGARYAGTVWRP